MAGLSNRAVAQSLGVSIATVSRLRSADRLPSFELMAKVAEGFAWPIEDQARQRLDKTWHVGFETAIRQASPALP